MSRSQSTASRTERSKPGLMGDEEECIILRRYILPSAIDSAGHEPRTLLFAGAEHAQRLHVHLAIGERPGCLDSPADIRGQAIDGHTINQFNRRR